jgi:hypothetical protein
MAADFNFPPSVLRKTGWLQLVNGSLHATGQPTCKGAEDDYFVVGRRLHGAVLGVAIINDTGARPHSAVRLWLKGSPRQDMVRTLVTPKKAEANLPQGCLPEQADHDWKDIVD